MLLEKVIYVIGCGRSGTTMVFDILRNLLKVEALSLDEPRALYMQNGNKVKFDIWSKSAFDNYSQNESQKSAIECSEPDFVNSYLSSVSKISCAKSMLLEKMPEHILRPSFLNQISSQIKGTKVILVQRHWYDVSLSISQFCATDWYGYNSVKWIHIILYLQELIPIEDDTLLEFVEKQLEIIKKG